MLLSFRLETSRNFVIDETWVEQVVAAEEVFALPGRKREALGLVQYHGVLVPVFEFRLLFPDLFTELAPLPHLILFRGAESLNAMPAEALETISGACEARESLYQNPFLKPLELLHEGIWYRELSLEAIEPHLNIP